MATAGSEWDFPGVWNGQRARVTETPRQTTGNNRWSRGWQLRHTGTGRRKSVAASWFRCTAWDEEWEERCVQQSLKLPLPYRHGPSPANTPVPTLNRTSAGGDTGPLAHREFPALGAGRRLPGG